MDKRSNGEWFEDLKSDGARREAALEDLRAIVVRSMPAALHNWLLSSDPQFAPLVEEVAQETLLRVLSHIDTFQNRSQFTTWVYKIAIRTALTELRRRRWKEHSLETLLEMENALETPAYITDANPGPEAAASQTETMVYIGKIMQEELSERQLKAMRVVGVQGLPMEEAARFLGTDRNALYKMLHDARLRLKRRLARDGLSPEELMRMFERK
jgi:RNA polymerase sigma-70 factor, ECF subfamily